MDIGYVTGKLSGLQLFYRAREFQEERMNEHSTEKKVIQTGVTFELKKKRQVLVQILTILSII